MSLERNKRKPRSSLTEINNAIKCQGHVAIFSSSRDPQPLLPTVPKEEDILGSEAPAVSVKLIKNTSSALAPVSHATKA